MKQHFVDVGEVRLHVVEAGDPDAPLVVLLHGFPEFWWSWRHQLEGLSAAGLRVVAPDLRGYNSSDKPKGVDAYKVEKLAGDVAGLIRALGRTKATVVGHDWGGMVAWTFAQEHPEMLERLAILNVPHPRAMLRGLWSARQLLKSWYMFFFQLPLVPERAIAAQDYSYVRRTLRADRVPHEEIDRYVEALRVPGTKTAAVNYYRAAVRRAARLRNPKTRTIEQPVLVIWGDGDRYLGRELATPPPRFVPNARVVHLPGVSHWVQNQAPERVNELLLDFVS